MEQLEQLRLQCFDEKDRFLISDKNTYDTPLKKLVNEPSKPLLPSKLPSRYRVVQREEKWGRDIKDPLAFRDLDTAVGSLRSEIINTN